MRVQTDIEQLAEPIIDPDLPIIDSHHHLWLLSQQTLAALQKRESISTRALVPIFRARARYLLEEYVHDVSSGHNIRGSVYVDSHAMYRASGPQSMRSLGEVEFANGVAAMAASGAFGAVQACAGIVSGVDLTLGDEVEKVLEAHALAGGSRLRGVRSPVVFDGDAQILGAGVGEPNLLGNSRFRSGFRWLQHFGLSFDVWILEPQLPELIDLARAFPDTQIVLNHVGGPIGVGRHAGQRKQRYPIWRSAIFALAECSNVAVKLGGLGVPFGGFECYASLPRPTSALLAEEWTSINMREQASKSDRNVFHNIDYRL
jgi:predicted TIM-barrel fold metal-dependent hydrolase